MHNVRIDIFQQDYSALQSITSQNINSEEELHNNLQQFQDKLLDINFQRYSDLQEVRQFTPEIIRLIFVSRMQLRDNLHTWHKKGFVSDRNEKTIRNIFRVSRYIVDMLGELYTGHARLGADETPYRAFCGPEINTLYHPSFDNGGGMPTFQSGDVLLVRGKLYNSAAIARIGDVDSQFSHTSIIHVDKAGKYWVVESLIEKGATITSLEEALDHGISRAILFRHKDAALAERASNFIYNHVLKSQNGRKDTIYYDFSMELDNYNSLFCSKLIRQAYDVASNGSVQLPTFLTDLETGSQDFLNKIGVTAKQTFAPGDLEIEPQFHLIAEWRDYRNTSDLRLQDLIMDKFFEWMDEHDYRFKETYTIKMIGILGKLSSYLSRSAKELINDILPQVPRNMSRKTIAAVAMLHSTADEVFDELRRLEAEHIEQNGYPMHPAEILHHMEQIRLRSVDEIGYLSKL